MLYETLHRLLLKGYEIKLKANDVFLDEIAITLKCRNCEITNITSMITANGYTEEDLINFALENLERRANYILKREKENER